MGKLITTVIMIVAAVVIFLMPTRSLLDKTKPVEAEKNDFKQALDNVQTIKARRDELEQKRSQFGRQDELDLDKFLPDTVDSVRLIVEIKDMVKSKPGLVLQDISISDKKEELAATLKAVGFSSTKVTFVVRGNYFAFKDLMRDIERSLRIVDVVNLNVTTDDATADQIFSVTLRTYWINSPQENV